ncbi:hypothetical protein EK0264_11830 [Epidermidibacterium keratini]|uniref:Uncharacterized protein n=1 Tax=Epidermidibacterium keratini TaxID=1891644 RepID=A0A7L4YNR4_9ACTN|nr:hypothetical protein [Epidermidibacterium keratini]QHC00905.1 hypothetical protein EK0264_11830 [Epidermidibacterium keratini]
MTNPPYPSGPPDPYRDPYGGPPTGDNYVPGQYAGPPTNGYGAPPPTDPYGAPPPTDPYGARPPTAAYEAQPAYGGYDAPPGPGFDGGSWNEPPKKNKQWWLIGGALVALAGIAVAVIILAINSGDDTEAGGGGGDGGGDTTTSQAPEPSPGESMGGQWEVTSTITKLSGVGSLTNSDGDDVGEGDERWNPHTWEINAETCSEESDCVLAISDLYNNDKFDLTLDGDTWSATYDSPFQCSDNSVQTVTVEITISREDGSDELTGQMKTADNGSCGPNDNMKIEEDLSLAKK